MDALSAAASFGLSFRMATASVPPVRSADRLVHGQVGEDLLPELRQVVVDDRRRTRPALTISRMSSSSRPGGTSDVDGAFPAACERARSAPSGSRDSCCSADEYLTA